MPAEQEHRDHRQAHRDLVGDHLRRRAQAAEQRVGRAGRPAGQHDAVHAQRRAGEDDEHADRQVGELQRGVVAEHRHLGPERDDREREERRYRRQDRRQEVDRLVGQHRDDLFLEGELHAVGERLQRAPRADAVRADAVLHPADDLALEHDREQRHDDEEREDGDDLDQDDPDRLVAEAGQVLRPPRAAQSAHESPPTSDDGRRTDPGELDDVAGHRAERGAHRAAAGVGRQPDDAVGQSRRSRPGTTSAPASVLTAIGSPSATPISAAVAADTSARAGLAVPARCSSPSCIRPASSSSCQVASNASPSPGAARGGRLRPSAADAPRCRGAEAEQLVARRLDRRQAADRRRVPRRARAAPGRRTSRRCRRW